MFGMNMPFISSEAKNAYFMSIHFLAWFQKFEFSFYYMQF